MEPERTRVPGAVLNSVSLLTKSAGRLSIECRVNEPNEISHIGDLTLLFYLAAFRLFTFLEVNELKQTRKKKKTPVQALRCPYCGKPARLMPAAGILPPTSKITHVYACSGYPKCDAYVCVHPGTNIPMGTLANPALRQLRQAAHYHFDKLHSTGLMTKTDAYAWLADRVFMPRSQAHIGNFSEYYCQLVIDESKRLLSNRRKLERRSEYATKSRTAYAG